MRKALAAMLGAAVLMAGAAAADSYTYGYAGLDVAAHAEGLLSDGSTFVVYYVEEAGAYTDTRYANPVNEAAGGQVTVCVNRRASKQKVLSDCAHAPLSAAAVDKAQLTGATFTVSGPSATRRGSRITARLSLKADGDAQVSPRTFDPGVAASILAAGAGGQVTRHRVQISSGSVRSSWLGGGTVRHTDKALLWERVTGVQRAVGNCYDRYCDEQQERNSPLAPSPLRGRR